MSDTDSNYVVRRIRINEEPGPDGYVYLDGWYEVVPDKEEDCNKSEKVTDA